MFRVCGGLVEEGSWEEKPSADRMNGMKAVSVSLPDPSHILARLRMSKHFGTDQLSIPVTIYLMVQ